MLEFGRVYNPDTKMFKGVKLQFTGRVTRAQQQRINDVFVVEVPQPPIQELYLYDSQDKGNSDSDTDSDLSSSSSSDSIEENNLVEQENNLV